MGAHKALMDSHLTMGMIMSLWRQYGDRLRRFRGLRPQRGNRLRKLAPLDYANAGNSKLLFTGLAASACYGKPQDERRSDGRAIFLKRF